jgi:cation diffusion facilitator CzcD-associated flavoprotein CzcO
MRAGKVSIVTDTITEFTEKGVQVSSGEVIEADIVVTATGFNLAPFGDIPFRIDGEPVDFSNRVTWRGIMISGVPNMAYAFGYFRHSWTLRVDLVNDVVARVLKHMAECGASSVTPTLRPQDADMPLRPWVEADNFNPGYVTRSLHRMFGQGDRDPWTHMYDCEHERAALPAADIEDGLNYH